MFDWMRKLFRRKRKDEGVHQTVSVGHNHGFVTIKYAQPAGTKGFTIEVWGAGGGPGGRRIKP